MSCIVPKMATDELFATSWTVSGEYSLMNLHFAETSQALFVSAASYGSAET